MRRALVPIFAGLVLLGASAAPAMASEHRMRVDEVLTSTGGDTAKQFVELRDSVAEAFPGPMDYRVVAYDASGVQIGTPLTIPAATLAANGTNTFLIATAAFGGTPDAPLTQFVLPTDAGQVCFENGALTKIHCLAYGCVPSPYASSNGGTEVTAVTGAPPDGSSAQRQADNSVQIAVPTPDMTNATNGTVQPTCPSILPPSVLPPPATTGQRAAALKKCKAKLKKNHNKPAYKKCKKRALKLPV